MVTLAARCPWITLAGSHSPPRCGCRGDPDARDRYTTSKLWIPFYSGPDSRRTDWIYHGEGRVVFSRNLDDGTLFAIRVLYDRAVVR